MLLNATSYYFYIMWYDHSELQEILKCKVLYSFKSYLVMDKKHISTKGHPGIWILDLLFFCKKCILSKSWLKSNCVLKLK